MNWLVPKEWLLIALFCAAALVGVKFWESRLIDEGRSLERADNNQKFIAAQKESAEKTAAWQKEKDNALIAANQRAMDNEAAAKRARAQSDSLRNDLTAIRAKLPGLTRDAVNKYADAASAVFGECSRRYQELAETADRIASERQTLIDAWPK